MRPYLGIGATGLLVGLSVGLYVGYRLKDTPQPEVISHMPAVAQADNSVILERIPAIEPAKPPHKIPRKTNEKRRVAVEIEPAKPGNVHVDLSLVEQDGGHRIIASSPDGRVVSGSDLVLSPILIAPEPRRWAVGASYDPIRQTYGAWAERDLGRLRVGMDARQDGIALRIGLTF